MSKKIVLLIIIMVLNLSVLNAQTSTYTQPLKSYASSWWENPYSSWDLVSVAANFFQDGWYFVPRLLTEDELGFESQYMTEIKNQYNSTSKSGNIFVIQIVREFSHFQTVTEEGVRVESGDKVITTRKVRVYKVLLAVGERRATAPGVAVN